VLRLVQSVGTHKGLNFLESNKDDAWSYSGYKGGLESYLLDNKTELFNIVHVTPRIACFHILWN